MAAIRRVRRIGPFLISSILNTGSNQPLTEASPIDKALFQAGALLVEHIIGLMNQTDQDIGTHGRAGMGHREFVYYDSRPMGPGLRLPIR